MAQPDLIPMPFAENATPGTIEPIEATTPTVPQDATWSTGFPQVTMQPLAAGGIPPRGQNFNGVLNALSRHIFHMQGGGQYKWSDDHGPYSIGDVLQSDDGLRSYVSVVDNNTDNFNTNPSAIGTSWLPWGGDAKANSNLSVQAGAGLTGGGTLTQNRTLSVQFGTTAGTVAQGNDSRIVNAVPNTRTITAGTGLSGGGNLSANRTLSVQFGTTAGTVMQGNDSRITGALQKSANLSDLQDVSTSRNNLGLGTAATRDVVASPTDTTEGRIPTVGWMGLGKLPWVTDANDAPTGWSSVNMAATENIPSGFAGVGFLFTQELPGGSEGTRKFQRLDAVTSGRVFERSYYADSWLDWREVYNSGNLNPVETSRQITAGTGLVGGGNLSANRTLSIAQEYWPLGVGQTWQDVLSSRANQTNYTNATGRTIAVYILFASGSSSADNAILVDGVSVGFMSGSDVGMANFFLVPPGSVYRVGTARTVITWSELR